MAEILAVESLVENLQLLLLYHAHLIRDAKSQIETLEQNLRLLKAFLRDSTKKQRKDESLREFMRQIRDVVYEAEDIIDAVVAQAAENKSKSYLRRALQKPTKLVNIAKEVDGIGSKVRNIYDDKVRIDFASRRIADGEPELLEAPIVRQDNVVGFEDDAEILIRYLTQETEQLDVITIVGMSGLGKTTLAGKIFRHPKIEYEFPTRVWVYVSQEFRKKDVFLTILRQFSRISEDMFGKTDQELAQLVASHLERTKFLIVMDDVWTAEDWYTLQMALPMSNKWGKVLITSCKEDVGRHANRVPHKLRFFTPEESWSLLQLEVFGKRGRCPPELEVLGRLIAEQCSGLPLAIVVIGGILVQRYFPTDMNATKIAWRRACESVHIYLNERFYNELPYYLRPCFLYFGMFPKNFEIPAWKLICMWIAEGFIKPKEGLSLEKTAESYLEDLINRSLVMPDRTKRDGRVKTCHIHNSLHDFCRTEASNERENFFQEIKESSDGGFHPPVSDVPKHRRLCIHSNVLDFLSSKPFGPRVRSFVSFSKDEINLPAEHVTAIPSAFKLLRVLDIMPIKFTKLPSDMYQLLHLRYLVLSFNSRVLPAAFSKLWNIQTLIVDTTSHTLEIRADIWKMTQLRHLKTNASTTFPKPSKSIKSGEKLQTLGTISPECCTEVSFDRARNLKKMGIRGRLALLLEDEIQSFDYFGRLSNLENLKLLNDVFPSPPTEGKLHGLPPAYKFPPKLRSLTLANTSLDWSQMSILGLLENLEVLKLKDNAFVGPEWVAADRGFLNLQFLHIGETDLVIWEASGRHFPRLRRLELQKCEKLSEVPIGLADIPSFQMLDLYRTTYSAAASAKKIHKAKQKNLEEQNIIKASLFKLSIYPSDE